MVAPPTQTVKARPAMFTRLAVFTQLTICRAPGDTLPLCVAADHALRAVLLALAHRKVEACSAACAEVLVEARLALRPALCTGASIGGACPIKSWRTGSQAHPDLLHPNPLQMHEEARLAGQTAIIVGAGQAATLLAP